MSEGDIQSLYLLDAEYIYGELSDEGMYRIYTVGMKNPKPY
jgi:hypothetical protein